MRNVLWLQADAATTVFDHVYTKAQVARVNGCGFYAVIGGQSHDVDICNSSLLQSVPQAGCLEPAVVKEAAVTVDLPFGAFVERRVDPV